MTDRRARAEAVEPDRSVIVQAPAGSGKTTLLVERFLGLLGTVEAPEEVLAITFTRKAAAEMRERVLRFLDPDFQSDEPHEQGPLNRAREVRDRVAAWRLLENPQRLLIRTIDSFNYYLARTMPVASALGPVPAPADDTASLYREAARGVLSLVGTSDGVAPALELLLDWRDHQSQGVEDLLAGLLAQREQWLRAAGIAGDAERGVLEAALEEVVRGRLERADAALNAALSAAGFSSAELAGLLRAAARTLRDENRESTTLVFLEADGLPRPDPERIDHWNALVAALLTANLSKPAFRRSVNVSNGFQRQSEEKAEFEALLGAFGENAGLLEALHRARGLPAPRYDDESWQVLDALVQVLKRAAVELETLFARRGRTDYAGLAAAALRGLGDEDGVTDLGLYLDRRIRHVLVDEFQDTNFSQLHLLEKLTAGWEPGDGRSLFLVGDPMQSIYRFREAEVGLFIRVRDQGLGPLSLESKRLASNFRSRDEIVGWVNDHLGPIFPEVEDAAAGAVAYAPSDGERGAGGAVEVLARSERSAEAEAVADLVSRALDDHRDHAEFRAAIIVRARSHLAEILPALVRRGVPYRAVKLDPLGNRPVVQDLLALTRVILQPADVAALLAVLRSPVCGLTLADLHALAGDGRSPLEADALARLAGEPRRRAARVFDVLGDARLAWRRFSVRALVDGAWRRLGGPECCPDEAARRDAAVYLDALDAAERGGLLEDWNDFRESLAGRHAEGDPQSEGVKLEVLTMHGAKGLEWDLVVLPALDRAPGRPASTMLHWLPFLEADGREEVLLAPLRAAEVAQDPPLVKLIRAEQQVRERYENQRVLYVACTRARERLELSATIDPDKDPFTPPSGSLLADLWATAGAEFEAALDTSGGAAAGPTVPDQRLNRIAADWEPPLGDRVAWKPELETRERAAPVEYNWAGVQARRIGTVVHRLLERVGQVGAEDFTDAHREHLLTRIPVLLQSMGTRPDDLDRSAAVVADALARTLDSETGRWLLSGSHEEGACELPIAGMIDGRLVNAVVDRTFVDADGVRWIVDYKSGYHAGSDLEDFFAQERERYQEQLDGYRRLFEQLEDRPVKTALYLPRHGRLEVVGPVGRADAG
jgi:ATP-dependent exoDNAse (exonuclease V) beta subunit